MVDSNRRFWLAKDKYVAFRDGDGSVETTRSTSYLFELSEGWDMLVISDAPITQTDIEDSPVGGIQPVEPADVERFIGSLEKS